MEDAEEFCIEDETDEEKKKARPVVKNAMDLQRLKLEKLMKNPDKPIIIPEPPREKDFMQSVPTFVRNVMGSSAGAGSGEFHVYRHLRRKEYARQKFIQAKSIREQLDDEYRQKLEQNRLEAEAKTAKRRAKRLKKKQKMKQKGKKRRKNSENSQSSEHNLGDSSDSESDSNADADRDDILKEETVAKQQEECGKMQNQELELNNSEEKSKENEKSGSPCVTSEDNEKPKTDCSEDVQPQSEKSEPDKKEIDSSNVQESLNKNE